MRLSVAVFAIALAFVAGGFAPASAQTSPTTNVAAITATEAANKKLVVDFWHNVFDAQDVSKAKDYVAVDYIQHNPNVEGTLQGFVEYFRKIWPSPKAPETVVRTQFTAVLAEGDLVQLVMRRPRPDPADATKTYDSYWFDLFRVKDGKIIEHWDAALKPARN